MKTTKTNGGARGRRRIFIVDDHPITRRGLAELINSENDLMVCGEADNASRALEALTPLKPDLVLADITLPRKSGLSFIKELHAVSPGMAVLVVSMHDEHIFAERVLRAGGQGYIMKSEGGARLLRAIRQVLAGKIYVSDEVSSLILHAFAGRRKKGGDPALGHLTDREFEVFQLLGQGLPTHEIGHRLHLSPKTIDTHRLHIKEKLSIQSLPELMKYAVRWAATEEMI